MVEWTSAVLLAGTGLGACLRAAGRDYFVVLLMAFSGLGVIPAAVAQDQISVQVVTHAGLTETSYDRVKLRALFTMRQRVWADGERVRIFVFPDANEFHQKFCRQLLGTYPYVLRTIWDRVAFTGTGFAPEVVNSIEEMRRKIESTPGAIGYLPADPESPGQRGEQFSAAWSAHAGVAAHD